LEVYRAMGFQELRDRMKLDHSAILDGEIVCLDD
jgi:ATP-dependent DNA ligase